MVGFNQTSYHQDKTTVTSEKSPQRHMSLIHKTLENNKKSDYTEKLEALGKAFKYEDNADCYWSAPEHSLLYGTPLYQEATETQKLALNHLLWAGNYTFTAVSETSACTYNPVTAGVFQTFAEYQELAQELDLETQQEVVHIRTFQRIAYKTKVGLFGREALGNSHYQKTAKKRLLPLGMPKLTDPSRVKAKLCDQLDQGLAWLARVTSPRDSSHYSDYLLQLEAKDKGIPTVANGIFGRPLPRPWLRYLVHHWGRSPFMACQYYAMRYMANALLKNSEFPYYKHYRQLARSGGAIPTPTAVSYYHLLDEAFHTTISRVLGREAYRDFPAPTPYEVWISNISVYLIQRNLFGGLSAVYPWRYAPDDWEMMSFFYKLLTQTPFSLSPQEALHWLEQCLCYEHEGLHYSLKGHQEFLSNLCQVFSGMEYLWPVNREMSAIAAGGSIERALKHNRRTFAQFSRQMQKLSA